MILKEEVKQKILTERWSISDKIEDGVEIIRDSVLKDYANNAECHKIDNGIFLYMNNIPLSIFGIKVNLEYYYYYANDSDICDFIYENADKLNGYDEKNKTLYITLYSISGEIQKKYSYRNMVHEVEHLLQASYGMKNNLNYKKLTSDAYDHASKLIYSNNFGTYADKVIAYLIYYSDSHEQDAFVNEYYNEILHNIGVLYDNSAEMNRIYNLYKEYMYEYYKGIDNNIDFTKALNNYKEFGYNQNNFSIMLKKQLNRLEKKMNNVKKHFKHISECYKDHIHIIPSRENNIF